ncbi:DUF6203 family protein [Nonomuraea candida]|uniref:DUF6203 family protein n=1 Tax=Nonomuraea candida TaxID=359159 RepID=UPI0005BB88F3|nr:DUF6203 family protein [Nonomuraea candida]
MKKLFQLLVARRLAKTPIGLAALAIGWLLARRRRRNRPDHENKRIGRVEQPENRKPGHRPAVHRLPY